MSMGQKLRSLVYFLAEVGQLKCILAGSGGLRTVSFSENYWLAVKNERFHLNRWLEKSLASNGSGMHRAPLPSAMTSAMMGAHR